MTDRRRASGQSGQQDNPFAAPPEDRPDQPWQPRRPADPDPGDSGSGDSGSGDSGKGDAGNGENEQSARRKWGSQWSKRQPGRQSGGFGNGGKPDGPGGPNGEPNGRLRWDPRDPAQRQARYALLAGMWGFFFALFNIPPIALLLGALAIYWAISSLRGAPGAGGGAAEKSAHATAADVDGEAPAPAPAPGQGRQGKPQTTAAVSGLVTGFLALLVVATTFSFQLIYKEYYDCVDDALTTASRQACEQHLPERLRPILGDRD
ncbi:hypothetical protein [Streptomyces gobiensis]|uniref:hypothetical protein n=1 Tax=Streptomyces gobiensis TaxID=2875706 RepID=UPI001E302B0B|nr:hypothetical protein [Streptomyces gobiensis]UGY93215.1 hypothetical protein test1122_16835 [Streptomyces gobiensis]